MSLETESKTVEILGLRERKKRRTREAIAEAAVGLFLRDGFDQVSVSHVAAAADVSKVTVFNYFPTKEDLVLSRIAHQVDLAGPGGAHPCRPASRRCRRSSATTCAGWPNGDPSTGVCADEYVLAIQRMILATPALTLRLTHHMLASEASLGEALTDEMGETLNGVVARVAAAQFLATERALANRNLQRLLAGVDPDQLYRDAILEAEVCYGVIARGIESTGCRWGSRCAAGSRLAEFART